MFNAKTSVKYILTYSYGTYLTKTKVYSTFKQAYKAGKWYKKHCRDCYKWYTITKVTTTKRLLRKDIIQHNIMVSWWDA